MLLLYSFLPRIYIKPSRRGAEVLVQHFDQVFTALIDEVHRYSGDGVLGALDTELDEVYEGLTTSAQQTTRQVFLRLVTLGEGTEDTRRRVLQNELRTLTERSNHTAQYLVPSIVTAF